MPTIVTDLPAQLNTPRKRWTRSEYEELSSGLLDGQRLELIEGELIDKMGKKRPHVNSVGLLGDWLVAAFGARFVLQEAPIDVAPEDNPSSEPEPDLLVLKRNMSHFTSKNPQPDDLHLVVEVADSTLGFDLRTKADLYARARIVEYWVLDVSGRRMIVHRYPQDGRYASVVAYGAEESVAPLAAPDSHLRVSDAFLEDAFLE
ncbi:MAG TPA: Uma2 family endonuclease [Candidatus Acidoferrales bacterium]|jgi:Uma2 family endonuclease|nr:Uma2 family endonuclease [Candidatus Acidoferrales bacterium]